MNKDKILVWVKALDERQAEWAWHYLRKQDVQLVRYLLNTSPDSPIVEKLRQVIRDFPEDREELLSRMRRAFSQKKLRDNRQERCAVNYLISKSAKRSLDRVSRKTGMTKGDVLSRLLTQPNLEQLLQNRTGTELRATRDKAGSTGSYGFNRKFSSRSATEPGCAELNVVLSNIQAELAQLHEKVDAGFASHRAEDPDGA